MSRPCKPLAAGAQWTGADPGAVYATSSDSFDVAIRVMGADERLAAPAALPEEVGAILQGIFRIETSEETIDLVAGEAIIVPPGEPREWTCLEGRGVLYRVLVTKPVTP